jgi:polyisoprenoid-binding protein YceI
MNTTTNPTATATIPGYQAGTWVIDPVHSEVAFAVRHMMVSKVRGRFDRFSGEILTAADVADSTITASIELASVTTGNERRDDHLRSADFFDVANHPVMRYSSTEVRWDEDQLVLNGDLTLRGVTRSVPLVVEFIGFATDPSGATLAGFSASGELNRRDFGVNFDAPLPGGGTGIANKIAILIDIEAVLQDGASATD